MRLTGRPLKECDQLLLKFHKYQPEIREIFHHDVRRCVNEDRLLVCPNGRRRDFFDRIDNHTYNEGISFIPQAVVSDQTKFHGIGDTWCYRSVYEYAHLLVEMHDGILAEVKRGHEEEFYMLYKKNVEGTPIDFRQGSLRRDYLLVIPCEIAIGENWYEMKEVKL